MNLLLFPYDKIKKDSNIIFYGAGDIGYQFAEELQKTKYCNIVCYIDQKYAEKINFPYKVFPPEVLLEIDENNYDNILVCIDKKNFWEEIKTKLLSLNVKGDKILFETFKQIINKQKPKYETGNGIEPDVLRIALISICGLGDLLIVIFFALHLRKFLRKCKIVIDIHTKQNFIGAINTIPYIDNCYPFKTYIQADFYNYDSISDNYDVILGFEILAGVLKVNLEKVNKFSNIFFNYLENLIKQDELICSFLGGTYLSYLRAKNYAEFCGKNMLEQFNLQDILPYNRNSVTYFEFVEQDFKILQENKLEYKKYITICVTANIAIRNSIKLWPLSYYKTLIDLIKAKYPHIIIVQIGDSGDSDILENADINLLRKTNLSEICVLLKNTLVHIGIEGGLIHLIYFLNNTGVLLAGATASDYYFYKSNINMYSDFFAKECKKSCIFISENEYPICIKNMNSTAKCMEMLYPKQVFEKISEYIDNLLDYSYKTERIFEFNCEDDLNSILNTIIGQKKHLNIALVYHKYYNTVLSSLEKANCNLTIYGRNLLEIEREFINSEYGFIYNIPSKDNIFDITLNFSTPDLKYPQFALNEALRITKENGIVLMQQEKSLSVIKKEKQNAK